MKRLAGYTFLVLATVTAVVVLWQFRLAVVLFLLSLAFAGGVRPSIEGLVGRGVRRRVAILGIYALITIVVIVTIILVTGPLLHDLQEITNQSAAGYDRLWSDWSTGNRLEQTIAGWLPPPQALVEALSLDRIDGLMGRVLGFTIDFFGLLSFSGIVLVLSLYWAVDRARFERLWISLLPAGQRSHAREIWQSIETGVGAYVRSEILQSFIAGWFLGIGYWMLGLPYPALLGLYGALAWTIPWLGGLIGLIPVLVLGWAAGPGLAASSAIYTLTVFVLLEKVIEPRILDQRQFSPLLRILAIIGLVPEIGIMGFILAPPLAAAVQIFLSFRVRQAPAAAVSRAPQVVDGDLSRLVERFDALIARIRALGEQPPPHLTSLADRLAGLIEAASGHLPAEPGLETAAEQLTVEPLPSLAPRRSEAKPHGSGDGGVRGR